MKDTSFEILVLVRIGISVKIPIVLLGPFWLKPPYDYFWLELVDDALTEVVSIFFYFYDTNSKKFCWFHNYTFYKYYALSISVQLSTKSRSEREVCRVGPRLLHLPLPPRILFPSSSRRVQWIHDREWVIKLCKTSPIFGTGSLRFSHP